MSKKQLAHDPDAWVAGEVSEVGCFCLPCQCVQVFFQCTSRKIFPVLCHSRPSLLPVWTQRAGIQGEISFLVRASWGMSESKVPACSCFLWSRVELGVGWAGFEGWRRIEGAASCSLCGIWTKCPRWQHSCLVSCLSAHVRMK